MTDAVAFSIYQLYHLDQMPYWCPRLAAIPISLPQSREAQEGIGLDVLTSGQCLRYQLRVWID